MKWAGWGIIAYDSRQHAAVERTQHLGARLGAVEHTLSWGRCKVGHTLAAPRAVLEDGYSTLPFPGACGPGMHSSVAFTGNHIHDM